MTKCRTRPPASKRGKEATKDEKFAAALLALDDLRCKMDPALKACVTREKAKRMTAREIQECFDFDHDPIPKYFGGSNHPTNLNPRPRAEHIEKTAKEDIPKIAKSRRILAKGSLTAEKKKVARFTPTHDEIKAVNPNVILPGDDEETEGKTTARTKPKRRWPKQVMPGSKKSGWKKPMRGKAERRRSQRP